MGFDTFSFLGVEFGALDCYVIVLYMVATNSFAPVHLVLC